MQLAIFIITILVMMLSLVLFPKLKIRNKEFSTHWMIILLGALSLFIFNLVDINYIKDMMFNDSSMNPLKLVVLFIFLTILSVFLDEVGFFKWIAYLLINKIKSKQLYLFLSVYFLASILTVFTSNDIVILTLTPFLIYFCKETKINPFPYLFGVLVAANTWSIVLIIGNPTNLYIASIANITFIEYLKVMALPGITAGLVGLALIYALFMKDLKKELIPVQVEPKLEDKPLTMIALMHLAICILLMALSNVIQLDMWLVTVIMALSLTVISFIYLTFRKKSYTPIIETYKKAPYSFIPMILSMFILISGLVTGGYMDQFRNLLNQMDPIWGYGISSHLVSNLMNNQAMSMLYAEILRPDVISGSITFYQRVYASIIGSNTGVLLTPFGALAGLLWFELLKKYDIKLSMLDYIKKLVIIGFVVLAAGLLVLTFII